MEVETKKVQVIPNEVLNFKSEYKCPYCDEKFKSHYLRERHINVFHPMERKHIPMRNEDI